MRFVWSFILMVFFTSGACAQVQLSSLQALYNYADENSAAAQKAALQPQLAKQDARMQSSVLLPRVTGFATGDYYPILATQLIPAEVLGGAPGTYLKAQFGLPYVFTAGTEVSFPVINLEKWATVQRAHAQVRQAQYSSEAVVENLHIQLAQWYYQYLLAKEVLKLNEENVAVTTELMRIMNKRNEEGVLNPADYNRSRNLQLDVQQTEAGYKRMLELSRDNLRSLLTEEGDVVINDSLENFSWPMLQSATEAAKRAAWQEVSSGVDVAELALKENNRAGLPRLNFNGRYTYNMQTEFEEGKDPVDFNVAFLGLRLDVPLFQGNYYRAQQKKSRLQLNAAKLEEERVHAQLQQQQQEWATRYKEALNKQAVLKQKVNATADNLRIAQLSLKEGVMEFDEFNNIFIEYNRARAEYLQNLADGIMYYTFSTQNF